MMNKLKAQIREKELSIQKHKKIIHSNYELLKNNAEQKLVSPLFLTLTFFTGFVATQKMLQSKPTENITNKPLTKTLENKKISYVELGIFILRLLSTIFDDKIVTKK